MSADIHVPHLDLTREDLLQLDSISGRNTLKLLPTGKKQKQKLVVGDDSGFVYCYEFKKGEPQIVFSYKAFEGPITSVAIGGTSNKRDKVFASHSQRIMGISKKGKEFFNFTSSLTEPYSSVLVEDTKIWSGCEFVYNLCRDGNDTDYYMSPDRVNGIAVEYITRESDYDVVLGCQDRCIRVVSGSVCSLEIPVSAPVTCVTTINAHRGNGVDGYQESGTCDIGESGMRRDATGVLYGLESGGVGYVQVQRGGVLGTSWFLEDDNGEDGSSIVTSIVTSDLNNDGMNEIVVGRDDGRVEVYGQRGTQGGMTLHPVKIFSASIGETVRAVRCGVVNSPDYCEIIVASYSGKIISFTSEPILMRAQEDTYGRSQQTVNNENRIKHLRNELKMLQTKVDKEKDKLKSLSSGKGGGQTLLDKVGSLGAQDFPVNANFFHDSANAIYKLSIEIQNPLDMVILRSPAVLELTESDLGATVVSVVPREYLDSSAVEENNMISSRFVAAYRCQSGEKRLNISLRPTEGHFGDLSVIVVANSNPKTAKVEKFQLKPLSLHSRVHELTPEQSGSKRSSIKFTGCTSIDQAMEWVQYLLPEVPQKVPDGASEVSYSFINSFSGAVTICVLNENEVVLESESISALSIARENISRLATQRRLKLEETVDIEYTSVRSMLIKIWPGLSYQLSLAKKMKLIESIQVLIGNYMFHILYPLSQ